MNSPVQEKDNFYYNHSNVISVSQHRDKLILVLGLNAWVGYVHQIWDGALGLHAVGCMNYNCLHIRSLCSAFNFLFNKTYFQ